MKVEFTPNLIYLQVPFGYNEIAKNIGALGFSKATKMWKFPNNIYVMRDLLRHFPILRSNMGLVEHGKSKRAEMDRLLAIKGMHDTSGDSRLRPYQRVDVEYLKAIRAAGVFNEQRTGKTPTIITTMRELGTARNIVVCPASLMLNWERELKEWYPEVKVFRVSGSKKQLGDMHIEYVKYRNSMTPFVLVISKDYLKSSASKSWHDELRFDLAVVDEAHFLRNRDTAQSKAVHSLDAERRYALTGTPTVKDGTDIYGIFSWLYPDEYTSYWAFVRRYFEVYQDHFGATKIGGYNHRESELKELVGFRSVQRKRKDVMAWLPPKSYISIPIEMDKKQKKLYDQMELTFTAVDEDENIMSDAPTLLAQLTRLRQLCLDPALLGFDAPSAKTDAIMNWLEDNPDQPVVIMSMFTSYLKQLKDLLWQKYSVGMLTGEMTNDEKGRAVHYFQSGKTQILLCNIISAGVGHTLDRADTVIFTDKAWNPSDQEQAEDRIVPVDESRLHPINIVTFPIADTVDEKIEAILNQKQDLTSVINTGARDAIMKLLQRNKR